MLYPSTSHFLLVDDVHQLNSIVALHVNHRPLQRILSDLVELRRDERNVHQTQMNRKMTEVNSFTWAVIFVKDHSTDFTH